MCCYKTLHKNKEGYVVFCKSCESLHVGYGNVVLSHSIEEFYSFEAKIEAYRREYQYDTYPDLRTVSVTTCSRAITLVFSPNDLRKLSGILHRAKGKTHPRKIVCFQ